MKRLVASPRLRRPRALFALPTLVLLLTLVAPVPTGLAQDQTPVALAEVPSSGVSRPGPIHTTGGAAATKEAAKPQGVAPVEIKIGAIGVDAPIEQGQIVDGVMQDPSGPFVVTWYHDLSSLGQGSNVVMAGHVDYWTAPQAVFYGFKVPGVSEGEQVSVIGEDGKSYDYKITSSKLYNVATELTPEVIEKDIVGPTDKETLTLITCGGEFNYDTGEYVSRMVVRATLIGSSG